MFDKIKVFSKRDRHSMVIAEQFYKLDFRVGEITEVTPTTVKNGGGYNLNIDFGEDIGPKKATVASLGSYNQKELQGKQVLAVVNITPKKVEGHLSEVFLIGAKRGDGSTVLVLPEFTIDKGEGMFLIE